MKCLVLTSIKVPLLFCFLVFVLCADSLSLLRRFPFEQSELNSAVMPHSSLFLPVSRGRVLRASRWVFPKLCPQLQLLCLILCFRWRIMQTFFFYIFNVFIFSFFSDDDETFPFQKTRQKFHQLWLSLRTLSGYSFTTRIRKAQRNTMIITDFIKLEAIQKKLQL